MNYVITMKEEIWQPKGSQASLEAAVTMPCLLLSGQKGCSFLSIMLCSDLSWESVKALLYEIGTLHPGGSNLKLMFSLKNNDVSSNIVTPLPRVTWSRVCYPIYKQFPWTEHLPLASSFHHQAE